MGGVWLRNLALDKVVKVLSDVPRKHVSPLSSVKPKGPEQEAAARGYLDLEPFAQSLEHSLFPSGQNGVSLTQPRYPARPD